MSDDCRHWTTPRWLQTIYERFCKPFTAWVAVAIDGTTPAPLNLTADGKLKVAISGDTLSSLPVSLTSAVSIAGGQSLTSARSWNLAANTDTITAAISSIPAISGSVSVSNFPATTSISGGSVTITNPTTGTPTLGAAVSIAGGQNVGISSLPAISGSVSVSNFPAVQSVSLVGDSLASIPASLTAAVSIAGGQSLTSARSWNLAANTDSLTAAVSSLPANLGTTTLAPAYAQVTNFPASTSLSGGSVTANAGTNLNTSNLDVALSTRLKPADTLAGVTAVGSITNAVTIQGGNNTAVKVDGSAVTQPVSISTVSGGLGTSSLTPVYDSIVIPSAFKTGQAKISVTGTAVQLGSNTLTQGVLISALSANTASITIGTSSSVTNTVDGTGNGAILPAGSTKSIAATNTNLIWINGTAGDIISFIGS